VNMRIDEAWQDKGTGSLTRIGFDRPDLTIFNPDCRRLELPSGDVDDVGGQTEIAGHTREDSESMADRNGGLGNSALQTTARTRKLWGRRVVIFLPTVEPLFGILQIRQPMLVQTFRTKFPMERFDQRLICCLAARQSRFKSKAIRSPRGVHTDNFANGWLSRCPRISRLEGPT